MSALADGGVKIKCVDYNTTGREFRRRYGLDYEVIMRHEHVNTADEIEILLRYFFADVKESLFGVNKDLAFYRFFLCKNPKNLLK